MNSLEEFIKVTEQRIEDVQPINDKHEMTEYVVLTVAEGFAQALQAEFKSLRELIEKERS